MSDRKEALKNALAQIEKQFGKGAVMKLGENTAMNVRPSRPALWRLTPHWASAAFRAVA